MTAFRRGVHVAVQAIVDDLADLVQRRVAAHSPELTTQTIVGMAQRIAALPMPVEDPGPAYPDVPATPRPELETLLAVAAAQAEASPHVIRLELTSDGVTVVGRSPTAQLDSVRAVAWRDILTATTPVLSLAVTAVDQELTR